MQALQELKDRLAREGLFEESRKRTLPRFPRTVGVVTSPSGAAIRDVVRVLRARWPVIDIVLAPVSVQGRLHRRPVLKLLKGFRSVSSLLSLNILKKCHLQALP